MAVGPNKTGPDHPPWALAFALPPRRRSGPYTDNTGYNRLDIGVVLKQ